MITPHCWNQGEPGKAIEKKAFEGMHNPDPHAQGRHPLHLVRGVPRLRLQGHRDRHDLLLRQHRGRPPRDLADLSKERPLFFMINLATGGGWPVDLSRV